MKLILFVCSIIILVVACDQHYVFLKKIKVDNEKKFIVTTNKVADSVNQKTSLINITRVNESNQIITASSEITQPNFQVYHKKPSLSYKIKDEKKISVYSKHIVDTRQEKPFPWKLLIGILLIIIGLIIFPIMNLKETNNLFSGSSPAIQWQLGCFTFILLCIAPFAIGLGLTIQGLVDVFK